MRGMHLDRDRNVAINILTKGLEIRKLGFGLRELINIGWEAPEFTLMVSSTLGLVKKFTD